MASGIKKEILEPGMISTTTTTATTSKQDHINHPNIVPSSYLSSCSSDSTSSLHSDSHDSTDIDDSFLEQRFRSTPAKRGRNSTLNDRDGNGHGHDLVKKKPKQESDSGFVVPDHGFLAPLPLRMVPPPLTYNDRQEGHDHQEGHVGVGNNNNKNNQVAVVPNVVRGCRQFWKAGDYEEVSVTNSSGDHACVGMDHARVHPKFLHSNATSHKWALGAFAELLDNAVDEVGNGATCVRIDVLKNEKDSSKMLLVEDDGGGMSPDKMRACMSLGYSAKSKMANTIGQYGNGFKTSTMRLGSDVIVFSRCQGKDGKSLTQSIGLLSYTFLRKTGKEDIVVPMVDFEKEGQNWKKKIRSSLNDWDMNFKTILLWSPFLHEEDLLQQFNFLKGQGTRIIIYNLWEGDDRANLELDFYTDQHDIQIRGVERDANNVKMATKHPNSKHFFTYQHSLRSYAAILYLKLPPGFRIILRGLEVEHHDLVKDMMGEQDISYKPMQVAEGVPKTTNMTATGKIGFVKDAPSHIDVQGFNVYHKNRLIKPFWRVWNAAGSDGRGVIGVLEANFVEPAHDKQGFERTIVLSRLEAKLLSLQKNYWNTKCHLIGYAARRSKNLSSDTEQSALNKDKHSEQANQKGQRSTNGDKRSQIDNAIYQNGLGSKSGPSTMKDRLNSCKISAVNDASEGARHNASLASGESLHGSEKHESTLPVSSPSYPKQVVMSKDGQVTTNDNVKNLSHPKAENRESSSMSRLNTMRRTENHLVQNGLEHERDRCQKLESQLQERTNELEAERKKTEELEKENQCLLDMLQEERTRQIEREDELMKKIKNASQTIEDLRERMRQLEGKELRSCKTEKNCY